MSLVVFFEIPFGHIVIGHVNEVVNTCPRVSVKSWGPKWTQQLFWVVSVLLASANPNIETDRLYCRGFVYFTLLPKQDIDNFHKKEHIRHRERELV